MLTTKFKNKILYNPILLTIFFALLAVSELFSKSTVGMAQAVDGDINKIIDLGPWALFILLIANKIIETISKKKDDNEILKSLNEERYILEKKIDELIYIFL